MASHAITSVSDGGPDFDISGMDEKDDDDIAPGKEVVEADVMGMVAAVPDSRGCTCDIVAVPVKVIPDEESMIISFWACSNPLDTTGVIRGVGAPNWVSSSAKSKTSSVGSMSGNPLGALRSVIVC